MEGFTYSIGRWDAPSVCMMLRQTGERETIADALTQVAALPCSAEGQSARDEIAAIGGLDSIVAILLSSNGDVRLQCKAVNALSSLCNSQEVAKGFLSKLSSAEVVQAFDAKIQSLPLPLFRASSCTRILAQNLAEAVFTYFHVRWPYRRLGCMLRSDNMWAQADAVGCIGWFVGDGMRKQSAILELVPDVTRLMVEYMTEDDDSHSSSEPTEAAEQRRNGGGGRAPGRRKKREAERRAEVILEQKDNLRIYSLIFLLKASCADPSIVRIMLENGALERLIGYLSTAHLDHPKTHSTPQERFATECGEREYAEQAIDDQDPSLLLISRLLFQFSQDRYCRTVLLNAKCVPALLRFRRRLRQSTKTKTTSFEPAAGCCWNHRHEQPCGDKHRPPSQSTSSIIRVGDRVTLTSADEGAEYSQREDSAESNGHPNGEGWGCCHEESADNEGISALIRESKEPGLDELITFVAEAILDWGKCKT